MQRRRRPPVWLGVAAVLACGVALGFGLAGAPPTIVLGTLAALLAIGTAIYSPALGLAVLAFSYPFDLTTYAGPLKLTTSEALLLILTAVLVGRHLLRNPPPIYRSPLDLAVLLFAGSTLLSLLGLTGFYSDQLVAQVKAAGGFLLFFLVTQSLGERRDAWLVMTAAVGAGLIIAMETVVSFLQTGGINVLDRATGNLIDPNLFAGYLVLLIPLALGIGIAMRWRGGPLLSALAMLVLGGALVATLSRGGWIGMVLGLSTLVLLLPRRRRIVLGVTVGVVAVMLIGAVGPIAARLGTGAGASPLGTFMARVPIWQAAASMFVQHPIFGIGVNNFQNFIDNYDPTLGVNQAHDLFLNIATERGIIGIATFLFLLFVFFRTIARALKTAIAPRDEVLVAMIAASTIAFLGDSLFDVAYYDYKILLLFWLVIGIGATLPRLLNRPSAVV